MPIQKRATRLVKPVLNMSGISKTFSSVSVLKNVQIELYPGEVHALMGKMVRKINVYENPSRYS